MHKFSATILVLFLILGVNSQALAYFNDAENSGGNSFSAASLDFSFTNFHIERDIGLVEDFNFTSVMMNNGSLPFQYTYGVEKISGNDNFCNALKLDEVKLNGIEQYEGGLMSFAGGPQTMLGTWRFEIELPYDATGFSHGDVCEIDFVFKGWQTDMPTYGSGGFSDEERIRVILTARMTVLNEFLPNPEGVAYGFDFGTDYSDMPQGEWVELYNNSINAYDLAGWYIEDGAGNTIGITALNTIPASTIIPAKGWLVVFMNTAILNNTSDTVKLFNGSAELVDSYSYSSGDYCNLEPTPGEENPFFASGSCPGVPPNKSYARIPDGIGDWVDPVPTPGFMNSLETAIVEACLLPMTFAPVEEIEVVIEQNSENEEII